MRPRSTPRGRSVAALAAVSMALSLAAPPAIAGEAPAGAPARPGLTLAAATSGPLVLAPAARAFAQVANDPAAPADSPRSFFRTRTGVAAIVLMVAGVAYVGYSIPKDNEKVHSPIR